MRKESKILIGIIAVLLVALPLIGSVMAVDDGQASSESSIKERIRQFFISAARKLQLYAIWFFKGAEKDTITGTVTARDRNILIVTDSDGDRLNIVLPGRWNIGKDVISLNQMFDEGYVSIGGTITLRVLKRIVTNEKGVTVTTILGYEITANGKTLYAVMPVNING